MTLRVLVVGDVHGDLERLFSALKPYPADAWRTFFLGDLVDGGPFGVGALRYARDRPHSTVLLGNHEVLMLGALAEFQRGDRAGTFALWIGNGGQLHDLEELARDEPLQRWLKARPALAWPDPGTLAQHSDNDNLGRLGETPEAINEAVATLLAEGGTQQLWDLMTPRAIFRNQPRRLETWLERTGARRVVHGHTPHQRPQPEAYARGRAFNYDGGLSRFGGARYRRRSPLGASVAPLPPAQ